ncbi:MAG: hypothetical protein ABIO19_02405 [Burkholderiaceae bacterium]
MQAAENHAATQSGKVSPDSYRGLRGCARLEQLIVFETIAEH